MRYEVPMGERTNSIHLIQSRVLRPKVESKIEISKNFSSLMLFHSYEIRNRTVSLYIRWLSVIEFVMVEVKIIYVQYTSFAEQVL